MSNEEKKMLKETILLIKDLNEKNMIILNAGAQMLKASQDMQEVKEQQA